MEEEWIAEITCGVHKVFDHFKANGIIDAFESARSIGMAVFKCSDISLSIQVWRKSDSPQLQP